MRFRTATKAKVKTLLLHTTFMDIMKTINKFGPNPPIPHSHQPVAVGVSTGHFNTILKVMLEHYCEYLDLVVKGQKQHLPPTYKKPHEAGKPTDARDTTLKIQSNGPNTIDNRDFPACDTVDTFALYKKFMLFEIVNELVTKEEPLYFNPPNLASLIAKPNSLLTLTSSTSRQSLKMNWKVSQLQQSICWTRMLTRQQKKDSTNHSINIRYIIVLKHIIH